MALGYAGTAPSGSYNPFANVDWNSPLMKAQTDSGAIGGTQPTGGGTFGQAVSSMFPGLNLPVGGAPPGAGTAQIPYYMQEPTFGGAQQPQIGGYGGPTSPMGPASTPGAAAAQIPYYMTESSSAGVAPNAMGATNPAYGTNPWATPNGTQAGSDFLAYRASQVPTFSRDANGQVQWNLPTMSNLGMGPTPPGAGITSSPYGGFDAGASNPNLSAQADDIMRRMGLFTDQRLAGIAGNSVGVGGLGGTRQAVAQAGAISQGWDNTAGQLANLFGGAWENQQNRGLQKYGMDQNYNLGARGQDLNYNLGYRGQDLSRYGMDQNFYTNQRGQDLQQATIGANLWNLGNNGAWGPINNANGVFSPYTGFGNSTGTTSAGGGWQGALGGGISGLALAKQLGWI